MTRKLPKNSYIALQPLILISAIMLTAGCDKKEDKPAAPAPAAATAQQPAKPAMKPVSSVLRVTPAPVNQFDFSTKKDPFKPVVLAKPEVAPTKEARERIAKAGIPIHSFDVSQFKLIGIITGGRENYAQVVDPNRKSYILKKGMAIGKNDGKVMAISSNGVDILEQFRDDNGRVRKENIKLTLPRKQ